ncbi:MAG: ribbon-helix-helix protein, CopG family [Sphingopyxis sp.]
MSKPVVISARIDEATAALLDQVAVAQGRSRAWLVAAAVKQMAQEEAAYLAFVQEGIDAADRGELIPHEDVQTWIAEKRRELMKRKVDKAA